MLALISNFFNSINYNVASITCILNQIMSDPHTWGSLLRLYNKARFLLLLIAICYLVAISPCSSKVVMNIARQSV